ncbi:MAG: two-component system VirA-like sensor kinase [Bradyrhizobium sp.]|uniref:two-component system VirA-like sensor kinase n=1 Tax=Bradyrhizobium sp. TaxID=376 RepID=UPI003C7D501C
MRAAPAAAIVAILVALLTWFSVHAFNREAETFDQAFTEVNRFEMIENALYRHVFTARAGMLRNYDPLVDDINNLRESLRHLRELSGPDTDALAACDRIATVIEQQEDLVERFKTENALLHNSLSFFGRFGVHPPSPELDATISAAAAAILHLALDTSSSSVHDVKERLDELEQRARDAAVADSVEALLAHGRLLNQLLPSVDDTLKALHRLSQRQEQDRLRATLTSHQLASRAVARWHRGMLYGTSLLLVAFLVYLGMRLGAYARALKRRAGFEHVIAGISMRFIAADQRTLGAEIDLALADICALLGPDRGYFVMSGPTPQLHLWQRPGIARPPGWPERASELAAQMGSGGDVVVQIPRVQRMPTGDHKRALLEIGLSGWACVSRLEDNGVRVALGFDAVGRPCHDAEEGELSLLSMALDAILQAVTRHALEEDRARLETRLQQAQRMEQIGFFTSGIAHNFNNILGGILGHSEVIEEHVGTDAKLVRNLGAIRRSAERARDLVDQILVFGRRRNTGRKPLSVGALVAEAASLLDVSLPSSIELVICQPPTAAIVAGDHTKLQQVLLNLCRNAANAMHDRGRIEVATELHEVDKPRTLSHDELEGGQYVCISVTDTGQGMDEAMLSRIFEPFFTTRPAGNGLGLATVREIVREHRGALNVQSKPGEGSRFEIWLPRVSATLPASADAGQPARPIGNGETVMLAAQGNDNVLRNEEVLAALGYEPVGFSTADSALAAARTNPHRFDIVVVGHSGSATASLKLSATLHSLLPRVPIVLATKAALEIGADRLVHAGIVDVVRWPLLADEIALALAHGAMLGRNVNTNITVASPHRAPPATSLH